MPLITAPVFNLTVVPSQLYAGQSAQAFIIVTPPLEYFDYNGGGAGLLRTKKHKHMFVVAACAGDLDVWFGDNVFLNTNVLNFTNLTCSVSGTQPVSLMYLNALTGGSILWTSSSNFLVKSRI
jgi:hypothetical protein